MAHLKLSMSNVYIHNTYLTNQFQIFLVNVLYQLVGHIIILVLRCRVSLLIWFAYLDLMYSSKMFMSI